MKRFLAVLLLTLAPPLWAQDSTPDDTEASAPSAEDLEAAKAAFMQGQEAFDAKKYTEAVRGFKQSYDLSKNPLLLFNIALTYDKMNDREKAVSSYQAFVDKAPSDDPRVAESKSRIKVLEKEIKARQSDDSSSGSFEHKLIEEAPPGTPLDLTAFIPKGKNWILTLHYRTAGKPTFVKIPMKKHYNLIVGRIPAKAMKGTSIQYYIEVKDSSGKVIDRSGEFASPNLVFIDTDAKARYYPDFDEGVTLPPPPKKGSKGSGSKGPTGPGGDGVFDAGSDSFNIAKWTTTGVAGGMLTMAVVSYLIADQKARSLEGEAEASRVTDTQSTGCAPPCRAFSGTQRDLQNSGKNFQTIYRVSLGVGVVAAGVAGYFWYKDITHEEAPKSGVALTPTIDTKHIGAAATWSF